MHVVKLTKLQQRLTNRKDPDSIGRGTIVVSDAKTLSATRLTLRDFKGPFNTHGIDIYSSPEAPTSVYIVAVNHLPSPAYYDAPTPPKASKLPQASSRLEIFDHIIGTSEATHLRSIWHPLIRTPNDVYFKSLHEIYVTNNYFYRDGPMRLIEDVAYGKLAPWTDLIHLQIAEPLSQTLKAGGEVDDTAEPPSEIMICRTAIGQLLVAEVDKEHPPKLKINETVQLPCTLDNPSYFADPYAAKTGRDASGYVLAGLARAFAFPEWTGSSDGVAGAGQGKFSIQSRRQTWWTTDAKVDISRRWAYSPNS